MDISYISLRNCSLRDKILNLMSEIKCYILQNLILKRNIGKQKNWIKSLSVFKMNCKFLLRTDSALKFYGNVFVIFFLSSGYETITENI